MSYKCNLKVVYKQLPNTVLFKGNLFEYTDYNSLKNKIFEKSQTSTYKDIKITNKDKFILELDNFEIGGITKVWNSDIYNYFLELMKKNTPQKLKLNIIKVDEYPNWKPPQFANILKESLKTSWNSIKKEIENDLTEKYLDDGKRLFIQQKKENEQNLTDEIFKEMHLNIICNNCLTSNFRGARYICCECDNFNLCEYCQKNARISHISDHIFIKLNSPISIDIENFNCAFTQNKQLLKKKLETFEINIGIVNIGTNDLKGCFISPIRFGKNYLGCLKQTIIDECRKGDKINLPIIINFEVEEDEDDLKDFYEGYFRLMTHEGIPFGDILYIKVIIDD